MKIAMCFPGCHRRGGVERITFECTRFLGGCGHDVDVFANSWEPQVSANIHYRYVPTSAPAFMRGRSYFKRCSQMLDKGEFDVVATHGCVCPVGGVHWVQSLHRAWLERSRQIRGRYSIPRLRQRLNPLHPILLRLEAKHFQERRYRKVIATTSEVRDDLHRLYGVPSEDVVIIPNGFSPDEFNPSRAAERREISRRKLGLSPEHFVILFVANELERKGYSTLLGALKILNNRKIRLLVVGRQPSRTIMRHATSQGVQNQVIACGPTNDVGEYHAAADLFVLPTQYEAFCLAILEALASGLPVVTSSVPGARDAIESNVNGFLLEDSRNPEELASVLAGLLHQDKLAPLARRASQSVTQYQWPLILQRYERLLKECCQN